MGIFYRDDDSNYMQESSRRNSRYDDDYMIDDSYNSYGSYNESSSNVDFDTDIDFNRFFIEGAHEIGETPSARPYDKSELSIPKSAEIDVSVYNKQIEQLKRTFKESVDIIESIRPEY